MKKEQLLTKTLRHALALLIWHGGVIEVKKKQHKQDETMPGSLPDVQHKLRNPSVLWGRAEWHRVLPVDEGAFHLSSLPSYGLCLRASYHVSCNSKAFAHT